MSVLKIFSISRSFLTATLIYGYVSNVLRFCLPLSRFSQPHTTLTFVFFSQNCLFCLTFFNVHFCFFFFLFVFCHFVFCFMCCIFGPLTSTCLIVLLHLMNVPSCHRCPVPGTTAPPPPPTPPSQLFWLRST